MFNILKGGGGGKQLTLAQLRQDEEIMKARNFLKNYTPQKIDLALRNPYKNAEERRIDAAFRLADKKTYAEMLAGGASVPAAAGDEEVIDEEMPEG